MPSESPITLPSLLHRFGLWKRCSRCSTSASGCWLSRALASDAQYPGNERLTRQIPRVGRFGHSSALRSPNRRKLLQSACESPLRNPDPRFAYPVRKLGTKLLHDFLEAAFLFGGSQRAYNDL